jgi:hypothetical protein
VIGGAAEATRKITRSLLGAAAPPLAVNRLM